MRYTVLNLQSKINDEMTRLREKDDITHNITENDIRIEAKRLVTKDQVQNGTLLYCDWYNLFQQYSIVMVLLIIKNALRIFTAFSQDMLVKC